MQIKLQMLISALLIFFPTSAPITAAAKHSEKPKEGGLLSFMLAQQRTYAELMEYIETINDPSLLNEKWVENGNSPMLVAATYAMPEFVLALINKGANKEHTNYAGMSALLCAAVSPVLSDPEHRLDQIECVDALVEMGFDKHVLDQHGASFFDAVISSGLTSCVDLCIEEKIPVMPAIANKALIYALIIAQKFGDLAFMNKIYEHRGYLGLGQDDIKSAYLEAHAKKFHGSTVVQLWTFLDEEHQARIRDELFATGTLVFGDGMHLPMHAEADSHWTTLTFLAKNPIATALFHIVEIFETYKERLKLAWINRPDETGKTALQLLIERYTSCDDKHLCLLAAKKIVQFGGDLFLDTRGIACPLGDQSFTAQDGKKSGAKKKGGAKKDRGGKRKRKQRKKQTKPSYTLLEYALDAGFDTVGIWKNKEGQTLLHELFLKKRVDLLPKLLAGCTRAGVSVDVCNSKGQTPLYTALKYENAKGVRLLRDAGADIDAAGPEGTSPHRLAQDHNDICDDSLLVMLGLKKGTAGKGKSKKKRRESVRTNKSARVKTKHEDSDRADASCRDLQASDLQLDEDEILTSAAQAFGAPIGQRTLADEAARLDELKIKRDALRAMLASIMQEMGTLEDWEPVRPKAGAQSGIAPRDATDLAAFLTISSAFAQEPYKVRLYNYNGTLRAEDLKCTRAVNQTQWHPNIEQRFFALADLSSEPALVFRHDVESDILKAITSAIPQNHLGAYERDQIIDKLELRHMFSPDVDHCTARMGIEERYADEALIVITIPGEISYCVNGGNHLKIGFFQFGLSTKNEEYIFRMFKPIDYRDHISPCLLAILHDYLVANFQILCTANRQNDDAADMYREALTQLCGMIGCARNHFVV